MFVLFLLYELCRSDLAVKVEAWTWVFDIDVRKQKNDVVVFLVKLCILKAGYLDHKLIETDEMTEVNHNLTLFLDTVMLDQLLRLIKVEVDLFLVSRLHLLLVKYLVDLIHIIGINDRISVYLCFKVIDRSRSNGI